MAKWRAAAVDLRERLVTLGCLPDWPVEVVGVVAQYAQHVPVVMAATYNYHQFSLQVNLWTWTMGMQDTWLRWPVKMPELHRVHIIAPLRHRLALVGESPHQGTFTHVLNEHTWEIAPELASHDCYSAGCVDRLGHLHMFAGRDYRVYNGRTEETMPALAGMYWRLVTVLCDATHIYPVGGIRDKDSGGHCIFVSRFEMSSRRWETLPPLRALDGTYFAPAVLYRDPETCRTTLVAAVQDVSRGRHFRWWREGEESWTPVDSTCLRMPCPVYTALLMQVGDTIVILDRSMVKAAVHTWTMPMSHFMAAVGREGPDQLPLPPAWVSGPPIPVGSHELVDAVSEVPCEMLCPLTLS